MLELKFSSNTFAKSLIWKINNHGDGSMQIIQTGGGSKATAPDGAGAQGGGGEALQITLTGGRLPLHPQAGWK